MSKLKFTLEDEMLDEMNYRLLKQYDDHPQWNEAKDVINNLDLSDLLGAVMHVLVEDMK